MLKHDAEVVGWHIDDLYKLKSNCARAARGKRTGVGVDLEPDGFDFDAIAEQREIDPFEIAGLTAGAGRDPLAKIHGTKYWPCLRPCLRRPTKVAAIALVNKIGLDGLMAFRISDVGHQSGGRCRTDPEPLARLVGSNATR